VSDAGQQLFDGSSRSREGHFLVYDQR